VVKNTREAFMLIIVIHLLALGFFGFHADAGVIIDPNGGRHFRLQGDVGSGIDPDGRPASRLRLTTHDGNGFEPHGQPKP
jgi:hypothetical protein